MDKVVRNFVVARVAQRVAMEFPTEEALKKYLEEHPDADPKNHSVDRPSAKSKEEAKDEAKPAKGAPKGKGKGKPKTYADTLKELRTHLEKEGWHMSPSYQKQQYATSEDGTFRLWFKPQGLYYTQGSNHKLGDARSLHLGDIRSASPESILKQIERHMA